MSKKILSLIICFLVFFGCEIDNTSYSFIPDIEFKELQVEDGYDILGNPSRLVKVHFYLIDGNGDIGPIKHPDFLGNCNFEMYFLKDGIYQQDTMIQDTLRWMNIPYVGDLGQDKTLKADVFIDCAYNTAPTNSHTSFYYSIKVYDMSLHESNLIYTDTVFIDDNQ